jgi:hypothetical protein
VKGNQIVAVSCQVTEGTVWSSLTPPRADRVAVALDLPEGVSVMLAMSVRVFLIAVVVLTIATVAFLIATA